MYLGPFSLRPGKNGSQSIALTCSVVFSLLLLLWLLLLLKKPETKNIPLSVVVLSEPLS